MQIIQSLHGIMPNPAKQFDMQGIAYLNYMSTRAIPLFNLIEPSWNASMMMQLHMLLWQTYTLKMIWVKQQLTMDVSLKLETVSSTIVDMAMFNQPNTYGVNPLIMACVIESYWQMAKRFGQVHQISVSSDKFDWYSIWRQILLQRSWQWLVRWANCINGKAKETDTYATWSDVLAWEIIPSSISQINCIGKERHLTFAAIKVQK